LPWGDVVQDPAQVIFIKKKSLQYTKTTVILFLLWPRPEAVVTNFGPPDPSLNVYRKVRRLTENRMVPLT